MPVCSYVVFPAPGRADALARTLAALDGCEVEVAENREMLLLVTSAASPAEDRALRERVESEPDIEALVLAFGEIDPDTPEGDPLAASRDEGGGGGGGSGAAGSGGLRLPVSGRPVAGRDATDEEIG